MTATALVNAPGQPPQQRSVRGRPRCDKSRQAILSSAYDLLVQAGLSGFTIEAVAARSGCAKTTIYRWWPTKGALAVASLLEMVEVAAPIRATGSARRDLESLLDVMAGTMAGPMGRVVASIIVEGQSNPEVLDSYCTQVLRPRRERIRDIVHMGVRSGELPADLDEAVVVELLYNTLYSRLLIRHQPLDEPGWTQRLVAAVLGPAKAASPPPAKPPRIHSDEFYPA
ncbi:TetR/AcrR family transcriptional regulator [Nitrospirillum sp. BR 11163]|uniref:TetR/AcrR family transcriptional regulator n=1 Tax=Nitrospirillum sp. BR 11163 TaxID=3104323 RepID=UPI002AFFC46F|nr:TetR/AcrR family transcriptional regulator C-terminal ligand-binding domain-containing protein [Nitrospirillum sp. BR 11163]MEA1675013.1 TetR/AcrR family transcriptional regulator C-terminal ligand-binding domain-containing protein [Nitrospirillum sp. BR 11163]